MIKEFEPITREILSLIDEWEPKLSVLTDEVISKRRNFQDWTIKITIGHMIDSASNNIHRMVHLQYQNSPFEFPNYAINGNNDRWVNIQNYQDEDWDNLLQLWKYSNLHVVHLMKNINSEKLENKWIASSEKSISLNEMVIDYLRHFKLHLEEIDQLINQK
jgi:hypothetical protein